MPPCLEIISAAAFHSGEMLMSLTSENVRGVLGEFKLQVHHLMPARTLSGVTGSRGTFWVYD
jgi:hypothetical protein